MRKKRTEEGRGKSLKTLFVFCLIVFFLITISLSIKAFAVIKASKFDGSHRFTLALSTTEKNRAEILSFDPKNKTISVLRLQGNLGKQTVGQVLATYVDGEVIQKAEVTEEKIGKKLFSLAMRLDLVKTNVTFIDLIRLSYFANTVSDKNTSVKEIALPQSETQIDRVSEALFEDADIVAENMDIEIVNATGVPGVGRRLERMLVNLGSQVVSVSTARGGDAKTSLQYRVRKSYTVNKLQRILGVTAEKQDGLSISDIKIILGTQSLSSKTF